MTWIKTIPYEDAHGRLKKIYDRLKGPDGAIDNILMAHSLRPHTLEGHLGLYKTVLHHSANCLDEWFLEAMGTYVSMINRCDYCVNHHYAGMKRLLGNDEKAKDVMESFEHKTLDNMFDQKQVSLLKYAEKLTMVPMEITQEDIINMQGKGCDDGEILEANQVTAYFNYANRMILGLGVSLED